jgi:acyl-CoA synthetase (AMP-forming)/AMP-acid ligase II
MSAQQLTVYHVLRRNAFLFGSRPALAQGKERLTYASLLERIDALAGGLAGLGIGLGERICILAQNDPAYMVLYGACAKLGAIAYPINWRLTEQEVSRVVERAQPRMLVVDDSTLSLVSGWPAARRDIPHWYTLAGNASGDFRPLAALLRAGGESPTATDGEGAFAVISTAAVDVIPRGAVLTHANVLASNAQTMAGMQITEEDAYLAALPMYHIAALGYILTLLHAGGKVVLMPRFDAAEALRLVDSEHVTILSDFPPVLLGLLNEAEKQKSRMPSLRIVAGLDQPDTIERLHKMTSAQFWTGFGQSETTGFVTLQRYADNPGGAGKPAALCDVRLVDEYDRDVPVGMPGEILVRGPVVFQGYYAQPDVTAFTLRGGWHHTGDVGRFDHQGYLYYVKRKAEKELIKPGGENVYPAEVETVIMELEGVRSVCVFGVPDAQWGEAIKAVVEVERAGAWNPERVIDHVGSRIARYKKPKWVEFTDRIPKTAEGAVDRDAVKQKWGK